MSSTRTATTAPSSLPEAKQAGVLFLRSGSPEENAHNASVYPYAQFLPHPVPDTHVLPVLEPFTHTDAGSRIVESATARSIFEAPGVVETQLTPGTGSEYTGLNLAKLDAAGRDAVALEVAKRGVIAFRAQEFGEQSLDWLKEWGQHFGRLHVHPTSTHPKDYPEFHLVFRDKTTTFNFEEEERLNTIAWHSDVSYEQQPPGTTTLFLVDLPPSGGDTIFSDGREAYNRLSPSLQGYLETLYAVHSGVAQAEHSRRGNRGGVVRREPVENVHPIVRVHPVTGDKALYVNEQFTRKIVGLKKEESDVLLRFLYDHLAKGADFHARVKWEKHTVVLWDNRITNHTAIVDFKKTGGRRHGVRVTPQAERPVGVDGKTGEGIKF